MVANIINKHAKQLARWLTTSYSSNFRIKSEAVTLANQLEYMKDSVFVDLANRQGFDLSHEENLAAGLAHADTIIRAFCEQHRKEAYRQRKITAMIDQNGVHLYVPAPLLVEEQAIVSQAAQLSAAKAELAAAKADHAAALAKRDADHAAALAERDAALAQLELAKQKVNRLEFVVMTQRAELALLRPLAVKALHAKALTTDFLPLNRPPRLRTRTRTTPVQMGTVSPGLTFGKDDTTWLDG